MDLSNIVSLDFETGSLADLKKVGAWNYAEDPTTRIICMAYQLPNEPLTHWKAGMAPPFDLLGWVASGGVLSGWNVTFEWLIWNRVMLRQFPGWKAPHLLPGQLVDTMAVAANQGLPLSLDMAGQALPKLGVVKDKSARALMLRMSRPRTVLAGGGLEWWDQTDPAKLDALVAYCEQDVRVERKILGSLPEMRASEVDIWRWDLKAMDRGIRLDRALVGKMEELARVETARLDTSMRVLTGGEVLNTRAVGKLLGWVKLHEPKVVSLGKDQLANWIAKTEEPLVRQVLEVRQSAAKSSVAKLVSMESYASAGGGRMRGLTQYYGAFRTGRWAGRGPQVQNYPRGSVKNALELVRFILGGGDPEGIGMFFGAEVMEALSSVLRGCLVPGLGKLLASVDFSQIEARVIAWLAGDADLLEVFLSGRDIYRVAAARIFGVAEALVTDAQRQIGKVAVLALGFGGGAGAFQSMAVNYNLRLSDAEADQIKVDWREGNPKIVRLWYAVEGAALGAVRRPGTVHHAGRCSFRVSGGNLLVRLPSGRTLVYRDVELDVGTFGNDAVSYMGVDQYTRQWTRIVTYGGKLVENVVQAVARDVMASAFLRLSKAGYAVLGTIHDELLFEVFGQADFEEGVSLFKVSPGWAAGLPIGAEGWMGERYRKG